METVELSTGSHSGYSSDDEYVTDMDLPRHVITTNGGRRLPVNMARRLADYSVTTLKTLAEQHARAKTSSRGTASKTPKLAEPATNTTIEINGPEVNEVVIAKEELGDSTKPATESNTLSSLEEEKEYRTVCRYFLCHIAC